MIDQDERQLRPVEELSFAIEEWDETENHVTEVLARASSALIGRAAFAAAVKQHPGRVILLRHRAYVVARSSPWAHLG
jgi:hypothetical protein